MLKSLMETSMENALRSLDGSKGTEKDRREKSLHVHEARARRQPHAMISADVLIANAKTIRIAMSRDDET